MTVGTFMVNRFCESKLISYEDLITSRRGIFNVAVSEDEIFITKCIKKPVLVASNFVAEGRIEMCHRWDQILKDYLNIQQPEVKSLYTTNIGGEGKSDFY